jgi:selenocysteine-specific elongation factor
MVKLLIGTAKASARAFVFKDDKFEPGDEGYCEFYFDDNVLARIGDRFIIRLPTPDVLLGGGVVVDTDCVRHSRSDSVVKKHYGMRDTIDIENLIESDLRKLKRIDADRVLHSSNFSRSSVADAVDGMIEREMLIRHGNSLLMTEFVEKHGQKMIKKVSGFHDNHPARHGMPKAELISKSGLDADVAEAVLRTLVDNDKLSTKQAFVCTPGFAPRLKPEQDRLRSELLAMFKSDPKNPPSRKQVEQKSFAMRDILSFMIDTGELVDLPGGLLLLGEDFDRVRSKIIETIKAKGKIDIIGVRELFGYSRKYGVPILEKLDALGITKRVGDHRELL